MSSSEFEGASMSRKILVGLHCSHEVRISPDASRRWPPHYIFRRGFIENDVLLTMLREGPI